MSRIASAGFAAVALLVAPAAFGSVGGAPVKMRTGSPPKHVVVAAHNSSPEEKAAADLVCTGTNDERVINAAIASLGRGGTVQLLDGDYMVDSFENEGNSAIYFGYNGGDARVVNIVGTTENKSYNTRFGVSIHVTRAAMDAMAASETYRVFYGASRRPPAEGVFFTYTHVNNANFENFYLFFADAGRQVRGIDGSNFGSMYLRQVGIYTERYFRDRFLHEKPATPVKGSVGVWSVPSSNDEMARIGYDFVCVGGVHTAFYFNKVDKMVMRSCTTARCCYGYVFDGGHKTFTMLNCSDEGNACLPLFLGKGQITAIDFNIERFNADYIPDCPDAGATPFAAEEKPGAWHGFISYTLQGSAFGIDRFWKAGHGRNFRTVNLKEDL